LCIDVYTNLNKLAKQVNDEIKCLEQELFEATALIRERIVLFPDNIVLIQIFASLASFDLFTQNTKRRIQETLQYIAANDKLSDQDIQEVGEDLSEKLGQILEAKTVIATIKNRLRN
jgi:HD-GYP domain-containing protein (c-di-GMP phosphodiesterase class II)